MRIAALYDIHGNLPALEAVLAEALFVGVDELVIGGDIFPGPMAREVLHRLRAMDLPVHYIRGNGDRNVVEIARGREAVGLPPALIPLTEWHVAQLATNDIDAIGRWAPTISRPIDGFGDVLFCHATPRDDNEMFNGSTPADRIGPAFAGIAERLVICGHTHRQFDRMIGDVRVANAGSVGMPFGAKDAEWLLLGEVVELRRTPYDLVSAAARIRATGYPRAEEFIQIALV
jgi:predicted phosphodiesterase